MERSQISSINVTADMHSSPSFLEEVIQATPGDPHLGRCIQCGTCAGSCPHAGEMDHSPREIFALVRADQREVVFASNTPWYCLSCYSCTVRCPQEVHITDLMYTLKSLAFRHGYLRHASAAGFSTTFDQYVNQYGRVFEMGLASRQSLRYSQVKDYPGLARVALGMLARQRMSLQPTQIKGLEGLRKILSKATEIEENRA